MDTGLAQPDVVGKRKLAAPSLRNSVQSDTVKVRLLGGAITPVGNLARDSCMVSVSMLSQHSQALNQSSGQVPATSQLSDTATTGRQGLEMFAPRD